MKNRPEISDVEIQYRIFDENHKIVSRADFAFPEIKYAVYCDGKQWHLNANQWQRDIRQRNKLIELGWSFSVFSGSDINTNLEECAEQVVKTYLSRM